MSTQRETVFCKTTKSPVEENINLVVQQANAKMKEFLKIKTENQNKLQIALGQQQVLLEKIDYTNTSINNKKEYIQRLQEQIQSIYDEIAELENEQERLTKVLRDEDNKKKAVVNEGNQKLEDSKYLTYSARWHKIDDVKTANEELRNLKKSNAELKNKWTQANSDLYQLEIEFNKKQAIRNEERRRADKGLENLQKIFDLDKERDDYLSSREGIENNPKGESPNNEDIINIDDNAEEEGEAQNIEANKEEEESPNEIQPVPAEPYNKEEENKGEGEEGEIQQEEGEEGEAPIGDNNNEENKMD
ncbi:MAG: hypothetical protein MJ252_11640 [archaeon]|nr:hypothetical protein [archaeon]